MKIRTLGLLTVGLLATLASSARAGFITNGGFTTPVSGGVSTYSLGSTAITGWTVISGVNNPGSGSVDLLAAGFITPPVVGTQTVDLDGTTPYTSPAGGVAQTVTGLTIGTAYSLTFSYSNNPNGTTSSALVAVADTLGGTPVGSLAITHSGATGLAPAYSAGKLNFIADATTMVVSFASTDVATSFNGIVLGNVDLNAVPEPASCAMLGLGLLAVGAYARRRKV